MKNRIKEIIKANNNREFAKQYGGEEVEKKEPQMELKVGGGPEGAALSQEFSLAEVLTVTTGTLMIPKDKFGKVADLLEYLEGVSLVKTAKSPKEALSRLSASADENKGWVFEQYPWMAKVKVPKENIKGWLEALSITYGEKIALKPKPMSKVGWVPPLNIFWEESSDKKETQE